jgi:hypothetical protein
MRSTAHAPALARRNRIAADDHLQAFFRADRARQTLRAPRARQQADLHFRQAKRRLGSGDAVVAAQRKFEAAAHADPVDRGDHRLRRLFHRIDYLQQVRLRQRGRGIELADIGAAGEHAVGSGDDDNLDGTVIQRTF